jgi:hypothetical protein
MIEFDMLNAEFIEEETSAAVAPVWAPALPQLGLRLLTVEESEAERRIARR